MKIVNKLFFVGLLFSHLFICSWTQVLFRPTHDIRSNLLKYIKKEMNHASDALRKIYCSMYVLSDKSVVQALIEAQDAGVELNIVLDESSWRTPYGKGRVLQKNGVSFYLFEPDPEEYIKKLMHAKMFIFSAQGLSWHGSYNCSKNAAEKNFELVTVTDDPDVLKEFLSFFEVIKNDRNVRFIQCFDPEEEV